MIQQRNSASKAVDIKPPCLKILEKFLKPFFGDSDHLEFFGKKFFSDYCAPSMTSKKAVYIDLGYGSPAALPARRAACKDSDLIAKFCLATKQCNVLIISANLTSGRIINKIKNSKLWTKDF